MTKELTEQEFIELLGTEVEYAGFINKCYESLKNTPDFKNNKPYFHSLQVWPIEKNEESGWSLIIESNCKKIQTPFGTAYDFGIVKMYLSDEEMSDELLDRYNAIKKAKSSMS